MMTGHNCESCRFRAQYDKNSHSFLGRIWRWHVNWCPGWKRYIMQLPAERREELLAVYTLSGK